MGRNKQPVALVVAKGKTHLTKEDIKKRMSEEVQPVNADVVPPSYLTKKQKEEFEEIAQQLKALNVLNETDVDAVARYVLSRELYVNLTKQLTRKEVINDPDVLDKYIRNQDKAFKQCRAAASDLGLTITSRAKLVVPESAKPAPKENKFAKFNKGAV
jgi:P27 family predicted phage terminase small subunit